MPDPQELADAEQLGAKAAVGTSAITNNPFNAALGSPTRALALSYRRGFYKVRDEQAENRARLAMLEHDLKGIDTLNPDHEVCVRCSRVAVGNARSDAGRLCHGEHSKPTCYELTVRGQ